MSSSSDLLAYKQLFTKSLNNTEKDNWVEENLHDIRDWAAENMAKALKDTVIKIDTIDDQYSIISVLMTDRPFVIDSITAFLQSRGYPITGLIHPLIIHESLSEDVGVVSVRINDALNEQEIKSIKKTLMDVTHDVNYATQDWQDMRTHMGDLRVKLDVVKDNNHNEDIAFLDYLYNGSFTFLGYGAFDPKKKTIKNGLGVLRNQKNPPLFSDTDLPFPVSDHIDNNEYVTVFKLPIISTVHRFVRYDTIVVTERDKKGKAIVEHIFLGLFTSVTYSRSIKDIPLLREKVQNALDHFGFKENHHDYKAMANILEKYPRDELFRINHDRLVDFLSGILLLQERQRIALFAREDLLTNTVSALLYIPKERFETRLRKHIEHILEEEYGAVSEGLYVSMDDASLVRVLISLRIHDKKETLPDYKEVEQTLLEKTLSWADRMRNCLPREKVQTFENVFPNDYQSIYGTSTLKTDIAHIEDLLKTKKIQLELYQPDNLLDGHLRFKIYASDNAVPLSDVLPIIENFGLYVISERPYQLKIKDDQTVWMHDFHLCARDSGSLFNIEELRPVFENAFQEVWCGNAANDELNRLIARANMDVRNVMILRSYARYLHQIKIGYSPSYVLQTLGDFPQISLLITQLFDARFNPSGNKKERELLQVEINENLNKTLGNVASYDQDLILRRIINLVHSSLRTNAYQKDDDGAIKTYISIKFDCREITKMPDPRPLYEIFVFSARMEGVHLRGGKVARGGIRWSDRSDDYRTEVLGLVKAQVVKNAVIIPTGAKGGFILKKPPQSNDRQIMQDEGIACYKILMRGLLDITDNRDGDKISYPKQVVRYDEDDSYLVVAADKGTASFSDIANGLAREEYNFWLDDAFASGGSVGYDHKQMAITARGAWECIKRHFKELDKNIQKEDFTVVGVGDMAGDVFGNGMLLSKHIQLIGAFNHKHIFCDPKPNAAKSFIERQRLFKGVKGWDEYKTSSLSTGGRIFERSEKSLKLTKEIKQCFGIEVDNVSPDDLIRALLKSDAELLYFGGIGTYIKGNNQSSGDVSDKANDRLRIDASEVNVKVIGEGANLAITQDSRIDMGKAGVKLNTDFIDNSAGVDCSDHEVNIKILFTQIMADASQKLTRPKRNKMLESMTDTVSELVLNDNYQQSQAISLAEMHSSSLLPEHALTIDQLVRDYGLNRRIENLPSEKEFSDREKFGQGLTRAEIAVVLSYAKMALKQEIIQSSIPDHEVNEGWLLSYFPAILQDKYASFIKMHPLRREIIATQMANTIVDRMGPHFIFDRQDQSGLSVVTIVESFVAGSHILRLHDIWNDIEALDYKIDHKIQMRMLDKTTRTLDRFIRRLLSVYGEHMNSEEVGAKISLQLNDVKSEVINLLSDDLKKQYEQRIGQLRDQNVPEKTAQAVTMLPYEVMACDALQLADRAPQRKEAVAIFYQVGERFCINYLRQQSRYLATEDPRNSRAITGLVDSLTSAQLGIVSKVMSTRVGKFADKFVAWEASHTESMRMADELLKEFKEGKDLDLGNLVMIEQKLKQLASRA